MLIIRHASSTLKELFNSQKILNIYKLNILNTAIFMHNFIMRLLLQHFSNFFRKSLIRIQQGFQNCATRYLNQILLNVNKYRISSKVVLIWNNFLSDYEKQIESSSLFKSKVKLKLVTFENEINYF